MQITLSAGRKPQQKRKLYRRSAEILAESPGLKPQDLVINPIEVSWENWSFRKWRSALHGRLIFSFEAGLNRWISPAKSHYRTSAVPVFHMSAFNQELCACDSDRRLPSPWRAFSFRQGGLP